MIINPFLLAGKDQLLAYQKQRVKDWETLKSDESVDFDHYFEKIMDQWDLQEFDENIVDHDTFVSEEIDINISSQIKDALIESGILNPSGFINLDVPLTSERLSSVIDDIGLFTEDDKANILSLLEDIQSNKSENFETYSKHIFEFFPSNGVGHISSNESVKIWNSLKNNGIIDEFGLILVPTNSEELTAGVHLIPGLTQHQQDRVLGLLNKHPELSYNSYTNNYFDEDLPGVKAYIPEGSNAAMVQGLTKDEYNYIKVMALLEWSMMTICQKGVHKFRQKSHEKAKQQKKEIETEELKFLAKIEAQFKQENKKASQERKKGD